ncbi:hypothetical protein PJN21_30015, partial [Mycobacterium kansasii]
DPPECSSCILGVLAVENDILRYGYISAIKPCRRFFRFGIQRYHVPGDVIIEYGTMDNIPHNKGVSHSPYGYRRTIP